jgi:transposase
VWPSAKEGKIALTAAQLAMLLEGIDWRLPQRSWKPLKAG